MSLHFDCIIKLFLVNIILKIISLTGALKSMNGLVNIWSLQDGSLLQTLLGTGGVSHIAWAGKYLALCHTRCQVTNLP